MDVKTKKLIDNGVFRMETSGEIQELLMTEDFLEPEDAIIAICFRGEESSGMVELKASEAKKLIQDLQSTLNVDTGVEVVKEAKPKKKAPQKKATKKKTPSKKKV